MTEIFTSIPPRMKRIVSGVDIGIEYQQACLDGWREANFEVFSLNNKDEISLLDKTFKNVCFIEIDEVRPRIHQFFEIMKMRCNKISGIVNSDCLFFGSTKLAREITEFSTSNLLLVERHNVSSETLGLTGESCHGFDAFFFNTDLLSDIEWNLHFHIGETWWDYWFPLAAVRSGCKIRSITTPIILHLEHQLNWDDEQWMRNGRRMMKEFPDLRHFADPNENDDKSVHIFARECITKLRELATPLALRAMTPLDIMITGCIGEAGLVKRENLRMIENFGLLDGNIAKLL